MKSNICLKCKRRLTSLKSIEKGYGPSCFKKMGKNKQKRLGDYNGMPKKK